MDTEYIREPLGVFAIVAPFNFPAMIPLYFTWAVACGNTVVIKPSEHCPLTAVRLAELAGDAGFPAGVVNLVLGGADVVGGLASHPMVAGLSFVGSSEIARRGIHDDHGRGEAVPEPRRLQEPPGRNETARWWSGVSPTSFRRCWATHRSGVSQAPTS